MGSLPSGGRTARGWPTSPGPLATARGTLHDHPAGIDDQKVGTLGKSREGFGVRQVAGDDEGFPPEIETVGYGMDCMRDLQRRDLDFSDFESLPPLNVYMIYGVKL